MRLEGMAEMSSREVHAVERKDHEVCQNTRKVCFHSQTQQADRCAEKLEQVDDAVEEFVETPQIQLLEGSYPMLQVLTQQAVTLIAGMSEARTVQGGSEDSETRDVAH